MATRAAIAYMKPDGTWEGVYSHWDGYPTALGKKIWDELQEYFKKQNLPTVGGKPVEVAQAIQAFVKINIIGHPSGWSSFGKECYCHSPEFVMRDGVNAMKVSSEDNDPLSIEYVYILDPVGKVMYILASESLPGAKKAMPGKEKKLPKQANEWGMAWNYGHCRYRHKLIATIKLGPGEPEPDWEKIEEEKNG